MPATPLSLDAVRKLLESACRSDPGGTRAWAKHHGFSEGYVHDVLSGRRTPSDSICRKIGVRRRIVYELTTPHKKIASSLDEATDKR